ncbi:MAG TPA: hypothetical protein VJJ81_00435 [Candidatus Babeliales bacterium]|nr:hypothetical protein [Candidatus Babeliales bacterium]
MFKQSLIALFLVATPATYGMYGMLRRAKSMKPEVTVSIEEPRSTSDEKENFHAIVQKFENLAGELFTKEGVAERLAKDDSIYVPYTDGLLQHVRSNPAAAASSPLGLATTLMLSRAEKPTETPPLFSQITTFFTSFNLVEIDQTIAQNLEKIRACKSEFEKRKLRAANRNLQERLDAAISRDPVAAPLTRHLQTKYNREQALLFLKLMETTETKLRAGHEDALTTGA